jgi:mRNA interferase YafQ
MKKISRTNRFKKEVKKMKKRGKSFDVFKQVIQQLALGEPLDKKYRDHRLSGNPKIVIRDLNLQWNGEFTGIHP